MRRKHEFYFFPLRDDFLGHCFWIIHTASAFTKLTTHNAILETLAVILLAIGLLTRAPFKMLEIG